MRVFIYDVENGKRGLRSDRNASERDANKVELATAHRTKSRADVLLIKIPPAPPSRNGGHVLSDVPIHVMLHKVNFLRQRRWRLDALYETEFVRYALEIRACVVDWQNASALIECMFG